MPDRYFLDQELAEGPVRLVGPEAHHLAHVMRAKPGASVTLFNGQGMEALARVERVGRSEIELVVLSASAIDRESATAIVLGVALPKGDRQRWLVEKSVELGVARLVPLITRHSGEAASGASADRLRRTVIEAAKQCGRNRLMEIEEPSPLADYLAKCPADAERWLAHPGASSARDALPPTGAGSTKNICLAVGPEGGFADDEVALAVSRGWRAVGLGPRILRVETAALALVSLATLRLD